MVFTNVNVAVYTRCGLDITISHNDLNVSFYNSNLPTGVGSISYIACRLYTEQKYKRNRFKDFLELQFIRKSVNLNKFIRP